MIAVLDNTKNVGFILMISGIVLFVTAIIGFFPPNSVSEITSSVGNIITGEVVFLTGAGIYRGKSINHFFNLFDDCTSRIGILCCMAAAFGLVSIIDGIFAIAIKDSINTIGNVISGFILLVGPAIILSHRDTTLARVTHVITCVASVLFLILILFVGIVYAWENDLETTVDCLFNSIILFIVVIYAFDSEVSKEIWGKEIPLCGCRGSS